MAMLLIGSGCGTLKKAFSNPDGTLNTNRVESVKAAFKSDVAAAVALQVKRNPGYIQYFGAAKAAVCDLKEKQQFSPTQVVAVVTALKIKELNLPEVLIGRSILLHAYDMALANENRVDLPPNSFRQALVEVLCDGITEGLGSQ